MPHHGSIGYLLIGAVIAAETAEQLLFRTAGRRPGRSVLYIAVAITIHIARLFAWYAALKVMLLGVAVPLLAASYFTVALAARLLFHEPVGRRRWVATAIIIAGLALVGVHEA